MFVSNKRSVTLSWGNRCRKFQPRVFRVVQAEFVPPSRKYFDEKHVQTPFLVPPSLYWLPKILLTESMATAGVLQEIVGLIIRAGFPSEVMDASIQPCLGPLLLHLPKNYSSTLLLKFPSPQTFFVGSWSIPSDWFHVLRCKVARLHVSVFILMNVCSPTRFKRNLSIHTALQPAF